MNNKKIIAICIATATISSIATVVATKFFSSNDTNIADQTGTLIVEDALSVEEIGASLEEKKILDKEKMFTLDHSFDSRFETFKDSILDIYTKVSNSDEDFQEVFIIHSDDSNKVETALQEYQTSLVNKYKGKNEFKGAFSIAQNSIIKTEQGITYFIASKAKEEIEKTILNEINN